MPYLVNKIKNNQPLCLVLVFGEKEKISITPYTTSYTALIDTGATVSSISEKVANDLDLSADARERVFGATGSKVVNKYRVKMVILFPRKVGEKEQQTSEPFPVFAPEIVSQEKFDVIVGMDIITRGTLYIGGDMYQMCV